MMKVKIYMIVDINGLKYVGSTTRPLTYRLSDHKSHKDCNSKLLDLDNCQIILLCECNECDRKKTEQYFIDNIKCVNKNNTLCNKKEFRKKYYINNKNKLKEYQKQYDKEHNEQRKQNSKERYLFNSKKVCDGCYEFIMLLKQY